MSDKQYHCASDPENRNDVLDAEMLRDKLKRTTNAKPEDAKTCRADTMQQNNTKNKLVIHNINGTNTEVNITPSQAASIAANIKDRCGKQHQEPIEGIINVFWQEGMSKRLIRKIKLSRKTWRRMHALGRELCPYRCTDDGRHYFHGVIAVPRSATETSEYLGQKMRELKAAMVFFHPACRKCRWLVMEKNIRYPEYGKNSWFYCKKQRYGYHCWPDGMACNCEHYKRKGKSK